MTEKRNGYFYVEDGYAAHDLLQFGIDHIASAGVLIDRDPRCYDSAGYISHIGFELVFKAIALHTLGRFRQSHSFSALMVKENLGQNRFDIPKQHRAIFIKLDSYGGLRYPNPLGSPSIGSEDWESIQSFYEFVESKLPKELSQQLDKRDPNKKGGRILMVKPKE